jgi:hypothetical protein
LEYKGVTSGYVVHCEGGYYAGGRGGGAAYDNNDKLIRHFKGDSGAKHPRNFVDAVFAHDRGRLNAEVEIGHRSTAWCNLANVASEVATANGPPGYRREAIDQIGRGCAPWNSLVKLIEQHLARNSVDMKSALRLSPILEFDAKREEFVGNDSQQANRFLRREYRSNFAVPSTV